MNPIHFSSNSDEWETPQFLFDLLEDEFGGFTCDVCATEANKKVAHFFSPEVDGLSQEWTGTVWMNPPYGTQVSKWVEKAYRSSLAGATCVCLLPARCDTTWWHSWVTKSAEIRFLKGRLKFGRSKNSAPFPSAIVIFHPGKHRQPKVSFVDLVEVQRALLGCESLYQYSPKKGGVS